ncbi:MAG: hypothetical protein JWR54_3768 [Mucilaginibacter sp.]|nr:hypothetical protein [Mucilaginibacter sp.]
MEEKEIHDELTTIRNLMERSSKFISLSGLSGILAGVYALIGAGAAYFIILNNPTVASNGVSFFETLSNAVNILLSLAAIAVLVLIASITTAIILSRRKAKKKGQSIWGVTSRALLFHTFIPLLTGGLLIILFLYQGNAGLVVPAMLIFYGLALVSASNFTFTDVKYLGLLEIALGLIAACLPGYGLLFWAIGFGVLHIIYGSMMYLKYDR